LGVVGLTGKNVYTTFEGAGVGCTGAGVGCTGARDGWTGDGVGLTGDGVGLTGAAVCGTGALVVWTEAVTGTPNCIEMLALAGTVRVSIDFTTMTKLLFSSLTIGIAYPSFTLSLARNLTFDSRGLEHELIPLPGHLPPMFQSCFQFCD
jgi:hypothetical protein